MSEINEPFCIRGISKTESNILNVHVVNSRIGQQESKNDYRTFFEKDNFEKYIGSYPKTKVKVKVLGYVQIPD